MTEANADARARRIRDFHTALDGALEVYGALVRTMIENADASGDHEDEWTVPRFTLKGGAGTYTIEPVSDLHELELRALVDACAPGNEPAGCRVSVRYRQVVGLAAGAFALEVWAR